MFFAPTQQFILHQTWAFSFYTHNNSLKPNLKQEEKKNESVKCARAHSLYNKQQISLASLPPILMTMLQPHCFKTILTTL